MNEIVGRIALASKGEKVDLSAALDHKWIPPATHEFPKDHKGRRFRGKWLIDFSWLTYSPTLEGGFCLPCVLFHGEVSKSGGRNQPKATGQLITKPLTDLKDGVALDHAARTLDE